MSFKNAETHLCLCMFVFTCACVFVCTAVVQRVLWLSSICHWCHFGYSHDLLPLNVLLGHCGWGNWKCPFLVLFFLLPCSFQNLVTLLWCVSGNPMIGLEYFICTVVYVFHVLYVLGEGVGGWFVWYVVEEFSWYDLLAHLHWNVSSVFI